MKLLSVSLESQVALDVHPITLLPLPGVSVADQPGVTVCVALQALHPLPVFVAGTADLQARMRSWYSTPLAANPPCSVKKLLVAVGEVTAHEDGNPPSETLPMPIS